MEPNIYKNAKVILIVGVILIIIIPFILTRSIGLFDFSNTGQIGDTIGGITAPISGLIGSALVFFALKAQIDANKIIQQQITNEKKENDYNKNLQYLNAQLSFLHDEIKSFSYLKTKRARENNQQDQYFEMKGALAINEIIVQLGHWGDKDFENNLKRNTDAAILFKLLRTFKSFVDVVKQADIKDQDRDYMSNKLEYLFDSKIRPGFDSNDKFWPANQEICDKCGQRHSGFPSSLFVLFADIEALLNNKNNS
tara:strand:- start:1458 stop:2216 length:759 start_codon:yes stop_codon:yes gene_type:complete